MMRDVVRQDWFGPFIVTVAAVVIVAALQPSFLSAFNIQILLLAISINALVAFSQMIIIAIGQMNLSVGAIGGLAAISFAGMMEVWGLPWPVAAFLALVVGLAAGVVNGALCAYTGISAFIITLATLSIYKGMNLGVTEAQPFYQIPDMVKWLGNATVLGPIPWLVAPFVLCAVALSHLLLRLPLGRSILAVGGNAHAAELSGISAPRIVIVAHALSGFLAAMAGVMLVARLQIGQPSIGDDWLILSFAAPIIGGAVLTGGRVSVAGTCCGVVIVAIITQVLVLFNIDPYLVQVVLGGLILWAVGVNRYREVRGQRRAAAAGA